jgi:hypothetical protein
MDVASRAPFERAAANIDVRVYACDAPRSGEVNLVDAQRTSPARWCRTSREPGAGPFVESGAGSSRCDSTRSAQGGAKQRGGN